MLVRFESSVAGELLMFADVARRLLTVAGKECSARGVILAGQIPGIISALRAAVAADRAQGGDASPEDEDGQPLRVSLGRRAQPFIEFLELTAREKEGFVIWEAAQDFGE